MLTNYVLKSIVGPQARHTVISVPAVSSIITDSLTSGKDIGRHFGFNEIVIHSDVELTAPKASISIPAGGDKPQLNVFVNNGNVKTDVARAISDALVEQPQSWLMRLLLLLGSFLTKGSKAALIANAAVTLVGAVLTLIDFEDEIAA